MAKEDKEEQFGFGGRSEGGDARAVFERHYGEDAWKSKHLGPNYEHKYRGKDGTQLGNGSFAERDHKRFEADRAWAAASGSWVANANEHAETLYNEHNMDYNDMKKYAGLAGISDINSKKDVKGIVKAYDNAHTSKDEMNTALEKMQEQWEAQDKDKPKQQLTSEDYKFSPKHQAAKERVQEFNKGKNNAYKLDFTDT